MDVNQTNTFMTCRITSLSLVVALSIKQQSQIPCILFLKLVFCHVYKKIRILYVPKFLYNRKRQPLVENIASVTRETK